MSQPCAVVTGTALNPIGTLSELSAPYVLASVEVNLPAAHALFPDHAVFF